MSLSQKNSTYPGAGYPDQLGPSGKYAGANLGLGRLGSCLGR